ncbi:hypothetical protein ABPG75_009932 [Micractinium tetrahymenae]
MQRRREMAVDDEEELLALQEQFAASAAQGDARPAAMVTRVSRRPADAATGAPPAAAAAAAAAPPPAGCAEHGRACSGHHEHAGPSGQQAVNMMAALQAAMQNIVGEVQEREVAPPAPPAPPAAPTSSPGSSAFPEATHRKLSKFALGRQRQRGAADGAVQPPPQPPTPLPASLDEGARIDAENRQLLAAMSPEQLAEAREEALQRLPPAAVQFLRRRGAQRAAATAADAPLAAGAAAGAVKELTRKQQASAAGAWLRFGIDGSVVGLRPADAGNADVAPADVAQRDPIRQEGVQGYSVQEACLLARSSLPQQRVLALRLLGAVLALARPRLAGAPGGGRVPLPADVAAELGLQQQGQGPDQLSQQGQQQQATPQLDWLAVWHHALLAADITLLLRRSLDDQHAAVAAAAAEALAALLGAAGPAGAAEEAAAEAADASPLTGWPAPPLRHLQRPTTAGAWVAAPTSLELQRRQGAEREEQGGEGGEEEPLDEQQLAKVDPLSGLLHMQLLERIVYLIATARAAPALNALLSILIRCCQAGKDVADQVADTPGMLAALKAILDAPPPPAAAPSVGQGAGDGAAPADCSTDATAAAFYAARSKALRLLRQLAAASKAAARRLQESGLVRFALEQLLRAAVAPPSAAGAPTSTAASTAALAGAPWQRGALIEALRLWRTFAQHGLFLALLDDAYPSVCHFFSPPAATATAAAAGEPVAAEDLQQWCVAREAYATAAQLCWHAARSEPHDAQLSPQCAAALASGALSWLAGLQLQQLLQACLAGGNGSSGGGSKGSAAAAGEAGRLALLSAYPALAAANGAAAGSGSSQRAVLLGALAAALHYVGSYWSVQMWHTAADKAAAVQQLVSLGLLPAAEEDGSSSGGASSLPPLLQVVAKLLGQLVTSDATWCQHGRDSGGSGHSSHAAEAAAAAVATAELAVALARLVVAFLPQRSAATTAAALLAPLCRQPAAARFLQAAVAADATLSQPWDAARQAQLLPLARAATAGLQMAALVSKAEGQPMPAAATETAQALLRLLPPGDEPGALQLLALLLGPRQLGSTLEAAAAAVQAAAGSTAAVLAADARGAADSRSSSPPALPRAEQLSPVLLAGYAAAWLGLVPEQETEGEQQAGAPAGGAEAGIALESPANAALLRPKGSRMPLPLDWALAEAPLPPAEAGIAADPGTAAGGVLALTLGWAARGLASLAGGPANLAGSATAAAAVEATGAAERKLRSAVLLLFGEHQEAATGVVPGAAPSAGHGEEPPAWRDPAARWCLAALMDRYASSSAVAAEPPSASSGTDGDGSSCGWQQQEARQLAEQFAAASYGDWLFGAAVALLLRPVVPLDTQLEVLSTLADEQALHLLPPLRLLPGPSSSYLQAPSSVGSGGGSSFGRACFGGPPFAGGGGAGGRRHELDLYVKLLSEGPLERCLAAASSGASGGLNMAASSSSEGDGGCFAACSAAVPLVLHRLACACFPDGDQHASGQQTAQQQCEALLCGILQRCAGGAAALRQLLGWLLRWDGPAGRPSDVIDSQRLAAIEASCAAAGLDAASLLQAAVDA